MIAAVLVATALLFPPAGTYTYAVTSPGGSVHAKTAVTIAHGSDGTDLSETATSKGELIATRAHFDSSGAETSYDVAVNGVAALRAILTEGAVVIRTPAVRIAPIQEGGVGPTLVDAGLGGPVAVLPALVRAAHATAFTVVTTVAPQAVRYSVVAPAAQRPMGVPPTDTSLSVSAQGVTRTFWYDPVTFVVDAEDGPESYRLLSHSEVPTPPAVVPTVAPDATSPPSHFSSREVAFASRDGSTIAGTISYPDEVRSRAPAVVLVGGSGTHDRDETIGLYHPLFNIAEGLTAHGYAVLRYDKRFAGASNSNTPAALVTRQTYLDDLLAAIAALRKDPRVDPRRVYLVGHSEGGELVMGAQLEGARVRGIAMLSPLPIPYEQALAQQEQRGMISPAELSRLEAANAAFMASWRTVDPRREVTRIDRPMLVIHGSADENVTDSELQEFSAAARRAKRTLSLVELPGDDHLFRSTTQAFDERVIAVLVRWLRHKP